MGSLSIRKIDDETMSRLKRRAARHGNSAEEEVRRILRDTLSGEAEVDFIALAAEVRKLTSGRTQVPSEVLVREGRDER
ncbi:MAG: hypothetical protein SFV21_03560 [Rhodospirillaceae bacterium]|nr:hypothetical protein [Rhodospirillaceae bacterium]